MMNKFKNFGDILRALIVMFLVYGLFALVNGTYYPYYFSQDYKMWFSIIEVFMIFIIAKDLSEDLSNDM